MLFHYLNLYNFFIFEWKYVSCISDFKENCPTGASCDSCGADLIDEIVTKLKDWEEIIALAEEGDDGKREDIRDEALTYLWVILYNVILDKVILTLQNSIM